LPRRNESYQHLIVLLISFCLAKIRQQKRPQKLAASVFFDVYDVYLSKLSNHLSMALSISVWLLPSGWSKWRGSGWS